MIEVGDRIRIPEDELEFQYVRSSGPGGQNVNKVATKAVLRWAVASSPSLPEPVRARFMERHANRINAEGELVISCDSSRSQSQNAAECLDRLRELIAEVADPPRPRKRTRPSPGAKRRRLANKRRQADKKKQRRSVSREDE
jgi:ribosome-associated protein